MIRVASIGYGDIAQRSHFPSLQKLSDRARLTAIAGRDERRLAECARRFQIPRTYTSVDEMLDSPEIDAVLILTPPDSHAKCAEKAIRAGKHVMIEKPLVKTMEEASRLVEVAAAQQAKSPVVCFPLPLVDSPAYALAERLMADGVIGEVTNVECHKSHRGPTHMDWFYRKADAGGGVLFDLGIYALGGVARLWGPARAMSALCTRRFDERVMDDGHTVRPDVEDSALVNLWLENGIAVTVNANWNGYLSHHHTRSRIVIFGREGMIHFGVPDGYIYIHRADGDYAKLRVPSEAASFDGYDCRRVKPEGAPASRTPVGRFIEMIENGETSTRPLEQQVHLMEIMLTAYECGSLSDVRELKTRF